MNVSAIGKAIGKGWAKYGSVICTALGIGGAIGAGVLGARNAVKVQRVIDQKNADLDRINKALADHEIIVDKDGNEHEYNEQDKQNDIALTQRSTIRECTKLMALPVALGLTAVGFIVTGKLMDMKIIRGQGQTIMGLTTYAGALEGQINRLYNHVSEQEGKEQADMLMAGMHKETITETKVNPETGETEVTVEEVMVKDLDIPADGIFTLEFKRGCTEWMPNRNYNINQFDIAISNLNDMLNVRGYVTMCDVCDVFGIAPSDRSGADNVIGWIWKNKGSHVDIEVIDYGIDPNDPDLLLRVKTEGIILGKITEANKHSLEARKRRYAA